MTTIFNSGDRDAAPQKMRETCICYGSFSRVFVVCLAILIGGLACIKSLKKPIRISPSLAFSNNFRDLGRIDSANTVLTHFPISNRGSRRLVLNDIESNCDCGGQEIDPIIIAPGGAAEIAVSLDARNVAGLVQSKRSFTTNDPNFPKIDFVVHGFASFSP